MFYLYLHNGNKYRDAGMGAWKMSCKETFSIMGYYSLRITLYWPGNTGCFLSKALDMIWWQVLQHILYNINMSCLLLRRKVKKMIAVIKIWEIKNAICIIFIFLDTYFSSIYIVNIIQTFHYCLVFLFKGCCLQSLRSIKLKLHSQNFT